MSFIRNLEQAVKAKQNFLQSKPLQLAGGAITRLVPCRGGIALWLQIQYFVPMETQMCQCLRIMGISIAIILGVAALTGCAAPSRQTLETSWPVPSASGQMALGVVASIRPMSISGGQIGAMAGVNAVLGALSEQALGPPVSGEEIVIRKDDGNTAAIVAQDQPPSLAAGDRVALIASSPALIIRRN